MSAYSLEHTNSMTSFSPNLVVVNQQVRLNDPLEPAGPIAYESLLQTYLLFIIGLAMYFCVHKHA